MAERNRNNESKNALCETVQILLIFFHVLCQTIKKGIVCPKLKIVINY